MALYQIWKIGSMGQNSPENAVTLVAITTGSNYYMTLETPVGIDFQVPAGYTLYISKIDIKVTTTGSGHWFGYGNTAVANGESAPTSVIQMTQIYTPPQDITTSYDIFVKIPAGKYPCVRQADVGGNVEVIAYGVMVANV